MRMQTAVTNATPAQRHDPESSKVKSPAVAGSGCIQSCGKLGCYKGNSTLTTFSRKQEFRKILLLNAAPRNPRTPFAGPDRSLNSIGSSIRALPWGGCAVMISMKGQLLPRDTTPYKHITYHSINNGIMLFTSSKVAW